MKKSFIPILIVSIIAVSFFASRAEADITSNLVGYWTMDDNAANTTVTDSSGNGNNGTATAGNTNTITTAGQVGQALLFASSNYVTLPDINALEGISVFSVCAWVKPSALGTDQVFVGKYASTGYGFQTGNGVLPSGILFFINGSSYVKTTSGYLANGTFTHVCGIFDNSLGTAKHKIYVDGVSVALTNVGTPDLVTATAASVTANDRIGSLSSAIPRYFTGALDDIRVYSRALSGADVLELYALGSANNSGAAALIGDSF